MYPNSLIHFAVPPAPDLAALRCRHDVVLDEEVVDRHPGADDRQRQEIPRDPVVAVDSDEEREDRERVHADALVPAELARHEAGDLREEQAASRRDGSDHERGPELVAPEDRAHAVAGARAVRRARATAMTIISTASTWPTMPRTARTTIVVCVIAAPYDTAVIVWLNSLGWFFPSRRGPTARRVLEPCPGEDMVRWAHVVEEVNP